MFDTILRNSTGIEFKLVMILMGVALVLGVLLAVVYMLTEKNSSKFYLSALVILPVVVCAVVTLVNGNLGAAIAVAGTFTLVRFRSQQGNAKEIAVLFLDMAIGLAAASGYIFFTVVFAIGCMIILIVLKLVKFGEGKGIEKQLKITMTEDTDYNGAFDEIFVKYFDSWEVDQVKTANKDTVIEARYVVVMKKDADTRELLKELGNANSHLPITLSTDVKKNSTAL